MPKSAIHAPNEGVRELLPAGPELKQSIVAEPPREDVALKPPAQQEVAPPKLPEAQPPPQQQPQVPGAVVTPKANIREGIPANYTLKVSYVEIRLALGNEGVNEIHVNLTDSMLASYPKTKEALINMSSSARDWAQKHPCFDRGLGPGCSQPFAEFRFNEQELGEFIQLVNAGGPISPRRQGNIERDYGSVITYGPDRYLVLIVAQWGPP